MESVHGSPHQIASVKLFFSQVTPLEIILFVGPFALLLASLALLPLFFHHFWESNKNKAIVALTLGLPSTVFFIIKDWHVLAHTALDYAAFVSLLGALFVISGGIYVRGAFAGLPWVNGLFLFIGALLANFIGTTGASMLLIRPLLRANHLRKHKAHIVVFFIFIVSNCSGLLTPLGDPPLFLGFLKGISFGWTLQLWPEWLFVNTVLGLLFFAIDTFWFHREHQDTKEILRKNDGYLSERFGIQGKRNFVLLAVVIGLILVSGYWIYPLQGQPVIGESFGGFLSKVFQVFSMVLLAALSFYATPQAIHKKNHFGFGPIIEVAVLFAGIFLAMIPALLILETQGSKLRIGEPWLLFWASGLLSGFLDNAPTYLTFTSLAKGSLGLTGEGLAELMYHPEGQQMLRAISCGAVMMGAMTYIGNGPNFMVKAIAEHAKVKMPGFFGYMAWSFVILVPAFVLVTLLFF
jgi:Na+/H+ antiporter NhaD/arsenite permease-like protein